jgi:predicted nucleotidyltransferase
MITAFEKIKDQELSNQLTLFVEKVKEISTTNLKSIILYGGVAKGDYSKGKSNTNVLLVFEQINLEVLDQLSTLFQQAIATFQFAPFLLTTSEIEPSKKVFAVKLFYIQQHHILLYGDDVLASLSIEHTDLRFIAEQELRNQLSRMKFFYIQHFNLPERLFDRIQKSFTTLLINANTYLFLKSGNYFTTREEIISQLMQEPRVDASLLNDLALLKKGLLSPDKEQLKALYSRLMLQYKNTIKDLEKLH